MYIILASDFSENKPELKEGLSQISKDSSAITLEIICGSDYVTSPEEDKEARELTTQITTSKKLTVKKGSRTQTKVITPDTIKKVNEYIESSDQAVAEAKVTYKTSNKKEEAVSAKGNVRGIKKVTVQITTVTKLKNGEKKSSTTIIKFKKQEAGELITCLLLPIKSKLIEWESIENKWL